MLYANNLSWSNLFNNLEKGWLLLSTLFLLFFCKLKSENKKKKLKIKNNPCIARVICSLF
jgi:hypothetical protein